MFGRYLRCLSCLALLALLAPEARAEPLSAKFFCKDGQGGKYLAVLASDGTLQVSEGTDGAPVLGQYAYDNGMMRFGLPPIGFDETSTQLYADKGLVLAFQMPSVYCGLIGHEKGRAVAGYARCPKVGYVPSVGWQENAFEFYADRSVKWRQWDELVAAADTLYSEHYGVYLLEGNQFWMVFPFKDEKQILSGTIGQDASILINELEPDKGACNPS
ncbi:MAG: hypothetical protein AAF409_19840 [Pseudomonadota bacterium]